MNLEQVKGSCEDGCYYFRKLADDCVASNEEVNECLRGGFFYKLIKIDEAK